MLLLSSMTLTSVCFEESNALGGVGVSIEFELSGEFKVSQRETPNYVTNTAENHPVFRVVLITTPKIIQSTITPQWCCHLYSHGEY